jgi:hypothetical protein
MTYLYLIDAIYYSSGRCNTCKLSGVVCVDISVYLGTSRCVVYVWLFVPPFSSRRVSIFRIMEYLHPIIYEN